MCDGFLAEKKDLIDIAMLSGTCANARVDLAEFGHDREHLLLDDLGRGTLAGKVSLICTQDNRDIDAEGTEIGHPEEGDALIAVVVGVDEENDVGLSDFLAQGRAILRASGGIDDGGGNIFRSADARRNGDLRKNRLDLA